MLNRLVVFLFKRAMVQSRTTGRTNAHKHTWWSTPLVLSFCAPARLQLPPKPLKKKKKRVESSKIQYHLLSCEWLFAKWFAFPWNADDSRYGRGSGWGRSTAGKEPPVRGHSRFVPLRDPGWQRWFVSSQVHKHSRLTSMWFQLIFSPDHSPRRAQEKPGVDSQEEPRGASEEPTDRNCSSAGTQGYQKPAQRASQNSSDR